MDCDRIQISSFDDKRLSIEEFDWRLDEREIEKICGLIFMMTVNWARSFGSVGQLVLFASTEANYFWKSIEQTQIELFSRDAQRLTLTVTFGHDERTLHALWLIDMQPRVSPFTLALIKKSYSWRECFVCWKFNRSPRMSYRTMAERPSISCHPPGIGFPFQCRVTDRIEASNALTNTSRLDQNGCSTMPLNVSPPHPHASNANRCGFSFNDFNCKSIWNDFTNATNCEMREEAIVDWETLLTNRSFGKCEKVKLSKWQFLAFVEIRPRLELSKVGGCQPRPSKAGRPSENLKNNKIRSVIREHKSSVSLLPRNTN